MMDWTGEPEPLREVERDLTPYVRGLLGEVREMLAAEIRARLEHNRRRGF